MSKIIFQGSLFFEERRQIYDASVELVQVLKRVCETVQVKKSSKKEKKMNFQNMTKTV